MAQKETILAFARTKNWDGLKQHFLRISNAEFRKVEVVVKDNVMPQLTNEEFWETYLQLLKYRRQAFLSAVLGIKHLARTGGMNCDCDEVRRLVEWLEKESPESIVKIMRMVTPLLVNPSQIEDMYKAFNFHDERECAAILVKESTPHAYYALFNILQRAVDNRELLRSTCIAIMKKNDDMSFNMASLLRSYFDLSEIKSTFSLQIEPYELSYIEQSYNNFQHVLKGKQPTL